MQHHPSKRRNIFITDSISEELGSSCVKVFRDYRRMVFLDVSSEVGCSLIETGQLVGNNEVLLFFDYCCF